MQIRTTPAQIGLIGVPWPVIGFEPSAAPNGGSRVPATDRRKSLSVS
jgi:hypothetical protein